MIKKLLLLMSLLTFSLLSQADSKMEMDTVMGHYENLHSAFFSYDAGKVELAAMKLKSSISKISDKKISSKLLYASKQLSEIKVSNDRKKNNELFNTVSMALIHVLKGQGEGKYKGYSCPMVKMKWIQNTEKNSQVMNPYAPEMPHCGGKM